MSREALAEHDRMIGAMLMPGHVVAVDTVEGKVRIDSRGWVSPWVRWHSQAAGKARHWRAPSINEKGSLLCPHGQPGLGRFIAGLYSDTYPQPDNRDHVEVWRFEDGGSLVYDWEASTYDITLPTGTGTIKVGGSTIVVSDGGVTITSGSIKLAGPTEIAGPLTVSGDITGLGMIIDAGGNTPNHVH
ncbi:phage baseplate assembly protein V [Pseudomonas sp. W2Oct36]|uniref:phage baseplate assembly protein V n=1 Tax=Pseudomonas sp. W2Oct36 TaxID=1215284 RepID=UPI0034E0C41E